MKLQSLLAGAAVLAMSAPAFAQNAPPPAPGSQPSPSMQPATPMPPPSATTAPPSDPSMTSPPPTSDTRATPPPADSMASKPMTYGKGWNASKCASARKSGKDVDPANCPAPPPKG